MLDLVGLRSEGAISEGTLAWFSPLWQAEQEYARELEEESRYFLDFEVDTEQKEVDGRSQEEGFYEVSLHGTTVSYCRDRSSTGHGNDVWAASISAAFRLRDTVCAAGTDPAEVRVLELGAGTGIPSLYLAQVLGDAADGRRQSGAAGKQVYLSDMRAYHNIRQLLLSVSRHPRRDLIRVAPHAWGEGCSDRSDSFLSAECDGKRFDVLIVADCIYNPEHQEALLDSICHTMARTGRAIVTFSLHGNTSPENVWGFFDKALARGLHVPEDAKWTENMEDTMKTLGLHRQNMGSRFIVHLHELRWR